MTSHYSKRLADDVAYHTEWTWDDAQEKYGRSRAALRAVLERQGKDDLIKRLNTNSGVRANKPYLGKVLELVELDPLVSWGVLSQILGKQPETIKQYLYQNRCAETVAHIDKNSKGV